MEKKILTINEVVAFTDYKLSYLRKLCSQQKIPHYKPAGGRRVFFCFDELIAWLSTNKIKTRDEIIAGAKQQDKTKRRK
jgi:predicted DNA-binding transcriptional regulator AlpA